ncbi:carbohydrate esterase family 8 protein [Thermothelomyces thermophilus ATCC 42464]|uniref:Pectinesterase n=1 Tax=Thermothelomyces thermophilus (strain ATCC 42464 / BCRC 31852 / DSM 1799) TaxID=573729 RepID=G2QMM2_THET4|nr:carbohydrate esterase family 8 protein [Thermothelomyces thermophilus ATCC 42464]AEO61202.1 carbohydrate esterase family 8 protein [Thermothelomyces thermophilus ATCC 42464]
MRLSLCRLASAVLSLTFVGDALPGASAQAASRTTPPSGCLSVGSGRQYSTITEAITALGSGTSAACIFIYPGTYNVADGVSIKYKGPLTLYGSTSDTSKQSANQVTFTRNKGSADAGSLDASATFNIVSSNFRAYNINFRNTYGTQGQAVAVAANGDKQAYYACGFYGYQDTLYAKSGRQYYSNCYIEGAVDFIFGAAAAWFGECTVASNGGGYITANSRSTTADTTWYAFDHSTIRAAAGISLAGKVFLGRPWRVLARVIFQNSELTDVVHPEGWTTMAAGATPEFREFQNTGAGSNTSQRKWLTFPTTAGVTKTQLWGSDWKTWIDTAW